MQRMKYLPDGDFGGFADPLAQRQFLVVRGLQGKELVALIRRQRSMFPGDIQRLNTKLIGTAAALRAEVAAWAQEQYSSSNGAYAAADLEAAILEAAEGGFTWQRHTNADLCAALGHCTLARRVEIPVE